MYKVDNLYEEGVYVPYMYKVDNLYGEGVCVLYMYIVDECAIVFWAFDGSRSY